MQKKKISLKLQKWLLKVNFKSILIMFFQGKDVCDIIAYTNHGMPDGRMCDGNEDVLINDGAVAVINCSCKHEFLCKWNC